MKSSITALALLASWQAYAQSPRPLTLNEALALAEKYNPRLRVASASVQRAEAAKLTARAYANPSVTFGSLGRQRAIQDTAVPGMLHGLTFNQPYELPRLRSSRIAEAEIGQQSTQFALSETRLAVFGSVRQAFFDALRRKRELELARDNLALLEDLRRRINVQVDVGEAARLELTRADAEVAAARIQIQSVELRRSVALAGLGAAIGTPLANVELQAELERPQILPPLDTLRQEVLAAHPSVAFAESETRRADANLAFEQAQRVPQPTFWMDIFQQPDSSQYRFGVSLALPLWNRREGPIAEAVASRRQAQAIASQRRIEISAAVERAYSLYQIASQQVDIFETGTLRSAEAAVQAAEAAFRFGERGIIEVLDAQRVLRAARLDYINAQFDRQQALIELEQLRAIDPTGGRP